MGTYDVIICGGGPVGMGLAIELGQRGVRVAVVERYLEPQPIPKGQNLTQRTGEHFFMWGCEEELREAHPIPEGSGIGGLTAYGTLLSDYHLNWLDRSQVGEFYYTDHARLPQYATEAVLRRRAGQLVTVDLFYGWSGVGLDQDSDQVSLHIVQHRGEGRQTLTGRYLVGCDGSHSMVRQAAGITETREDHARKMALLVFESEALDTLLKRYPGKAFYNVLNPENDGYWWFFGRVDHGKSWFFHAPVPMDATEETYDFAALLHKAVGAEFDLSLDYVGFWDMRFAIADSYRKGRVFVAGDAAHSHPPYGGYGINTGLEDAANLGWKLAAAVQGWGNDALLDSYHDERHPVFASTARDFIGRFIREDRAFLETYSPDRDLGAFKAAWEARATADEVLSYAPNYAGSPIVAGHGDGPGVRADHSMVARAGHHFAPAPIKGGGDVFDRLSDGFTLLCFDAGMGDVIATFERAAEAMKVPLAIVELPDPTLRDRYQAALVLVRPDQFVAWTGDKGEGQVVLARALARKQRETAAATA